MIKASSNITNLIKSEPVEIIKSDGTSCITKVSLIEESVLNIYLNNKFIVKVNCLPEMLCELVVGLLYNMNQINDYADIVSVTVDEKKGDIFVVSSDYSDNIKEDTSLHPINPITYDYTKIYELINIFSEDMPFHKATSCTHSCFLANKNKLLIALEDMGRHNAVDKAIGYALINNINLSDCMLFTSGRVPYDLVTKIINAGIPILISKSMPTQKAVALAQKYKLTLLCHARDDSFYKFS